MTQRTHDLAAVTLVSYRFLAFTSGPLSWETILGIGVGALLGGLIPDIDNVASKAGKFSLTPWEDDLTRHSLSGHRNLSHSLLGLISFSAILGLLLNVVKLPNIGIEPIVEAFAWGYLSHLLADSLTHDGVPWFYPIDIHLGFPPFKFLRLKTGGLLEKFVVFPALLVFTVRTFYKYRENLAILLGEIL